MIPRRNNNKAATTIPTATATAVAMPEQQDSDYEDYFSDTETERTLSAEARTLSNLSNMSSMGSLTTPNTGYYLDVPMPEPNNKVSAKMLATARQRSISNMKKKMQQQHHQFRSSTQSNDGTVNTSASELSYAARAYDLNGDGKLDPAELLMREKDGSGRGFLKNEEIYDLVADQLRFQKNAGKMRRLIAFLLCFVVVMACSNLATSWASATLAKDLKADDTTKSNYNGGDEGDGEEEGGAPPAMRIASTNKIASAQSIADVYTATEMTDEQLEYRRNLILDEIEEDPHSHAHRRILNTNQGGRDNNIHRDLLACRACRARDCVSQCTSQYISFDSSTMPDEEFSTLEDDCVKQKNIYIKRRWGGSRLNSRNEAICSRGTSVTVRYKKKKNRGKKQQNQGVGKKGPREDSNKLTKKEKKANGDRELDIEMSEEELEQEEEYLLENGESEDELEYEDEEENGYYGERELKNKKNKKQKKRQRKKDREVIITQENGRVLHADCMDGLCYIGGTILQGTLGDDCRVGGTECLSGYVCQPEDNPRKRMARYGTCQRVSVEMTNVVRSVDAGPGGYCNVEKGWDACVSGFYCLVEDSDESGYDAGYGSSNGLSNFGLQVFNRSSRRDYLRGGYGRYGNNIGDCTDDHDSCAPGYGCVKSTPFNDQAERWSCIFGASNGMEMRSSSSSTVGTCVATVGYGQTCYSDYECGQEGYCDIAGVIRGRSRDGLSRGICAPSLADDIRTAMAEYDSRNRPLYGNEDCTNNRNGCANGYTCRLSGRSNRWTCQ